MQHVKNSINRFPCGIFIYYLVLMLVTDGIWAIASPLLPSAGVKLILLSGFWATLLALPTMPASGKLFRKIYIGITTIIILAFITVDYFGWFAFSMIIDWQMLDLLDNTNAAETQGFFSTYITFGSLILIAISLAALVLAAWGLGRLLQRFHTIVFALAAIFLLSGSVIYGQTVYSFVRYHNGESVPRLVPFTRLAYAKVQQKKHRQEQDRLLQVVSDEVSLPPTMVTPDSVTVVFVLGESHSYFHNPYTGYDKNTQPLMQARITGSDSLRTVVFTDAITSNDRTDYVMEAVFTLGGPTKCGNQPLFPAIFKRNGFATTLADNAYGTGGGASFMLNPEINAALYDIRNDRTFKSDEELLAVLADSAVAPSLEIVHLHGSHFPYETRYDASRFGHFTASDYDPTRHNETQRKIMAHYDNSLLQTDALLDSIIRRVENGNAVVVYMSDHGEEVFELRDYHGHSCATSSPDPKYQIRVPMIVWVSEKYASNYPERLTSLFANKDKKVITDDTSYLLLTLAGITDERIDSTRSVATDKYIERPRTILNSYKFDAEE